MDWRLDRVGSALTGDNPTVLRRLRAGFAVIGDHQHLPGYCVLITDDPAADQLTDLRLDRQRLFLDDMALLATAVATVCARRDRDFRRVNAEIQGNTDAFLHAHVTPRYIWSRPTSSDCLRSCTTCEGWSIRSPIGSGPSTTTSAGSSGRRSTTSSPAGPEAVVHRTDERAGEQGLAPPASGG